MKGIDKTTGKRLSGIEHLRQSIGDILSTPLGSRVMRRDYGSRLYELVDKPMNPQTLLEIYAAAAEALDRWEPRLRAVRIQAVSAHPGQIELSVTGFYRPADQEITIAGIII